MTTNTKEIRIGAAGLSNAARANNVKRYALGREVYRIEQAIKQDPADYRSRRDELDAQLSAARKAYQAFPLDFGGDNSTALGVKGKKAQTKAKDDSE